MTPTATGEDELIIISDTVPTTSFDDINILGDSLQINNSPSPIISFDSDSLIQNGTIEQTITSADVKQENSNPNEISFDSNVNFLFGDEKKQDPISAPINTSTQVDDLFGDMNNGSQVLVNDIAVAPKEEVSNDLFGDFQLNNSNDVIVEVKPIEPENKEVNNVFSNETSVSESTLNNVTEDSTDLGDMNTILDSTISKLQKRKTGIAGTKSGKIANITDLEAKIKELKEQVSVLKKDVESLDEEDLQIDVNISSLENMKLGQNIKVPLKTREHNIKRVAKVA